MVLNTTHYFYSQDFEKSRVKGFGFVTFADSSHASEAIRMFNNARVGGRSITLSYAHDDKPARYATKRYDAIRNSPSQLCCKLSLFFFVGKCLTVTPSPLKGSQKVAGLYHLCFFVDGVK